jgi:hypothetical protein
MASLELLLWCNRHPATGAGKHLALEPVPQPRTGRASAGDNLATAHEQDLSRSRKIWLAKLVASER